MNQIMPENPEELIGTTLGPYHIEGIEGKTDKSWVFRAENWPLKRIDALKVLKPGQSNERIIQFEEEGKNLAVLEDHNNITTVYSAEEDKGLKYMAMKYVKGPNLQFLLDKGVLFPIKETVNLIIDVSNAVAYAHSKGFEHRDIKPANIKVAEGEKSKKTYLVDFGGRLSEPLTSDVASIGLIAKQLLEKREKTDEKIPRTLECIVNGAIKDVYESPEEFKKAIENYKNSIVTRRIILTGGIAAAATTLIGVPIGVKYCYLDSIGYTLSKLEKTSSEEIENIKSLLGEFHFKVSDQKTRKLIGKKGIPRGKYPYAISGGGREYNLPDNPYWTDGFFSGRLWLAFKRTNDPDFKDDALDRVSNMNFFEDENKTLSEIRFYYSHAIGFDIIKDSELKEKSVIMPGLKSTALIAAERITENFNENGKYIQVAGEINNSRGQILFIHAMDFAFPLLSWAFSKTGNQKYRDIISSHADATMKYNINEDGSVIQASLFDPIKEIRIKGIKSYGYSEDSCLARAQARAVRGLLIAYEVTKNEKYLKQAEKCNTYYYSKLQEKSDDRVPPYDFKIPSSFKENSDKKIPKDSSASAIATCGSLDLFMKTHERKHEVDATETLKSLAVKYFPKQKDYQGLLLHGCSKAGGAYEDASLIFGDYYFEEALSRI